MQTLAKGFSCLHPGDTLYLRQGTYSQRIYPGDFHIPSGAAGAPITIAGYPAETVTLTAGIALQGNLDGSIPQYLTFDHVIVQNTNDAAFSVGATCHHIQFTNSEAQTFGSAGSMNVIVIGSSTTYVSVLGSNIHGAPIGFDFGAVTGHYGFYANGNHMVIDKNTIHDNTGYGIHMFLSGGSMNVSDNTISNNIIYGNCTDDGARGQGMNAVILSNGSNNLFYNNVVVNNTGAQCVGAVSISVTENAMVYNNTIVNNAGEAITVNTNAANPKIQNNILYSNTTNAVVDYGSINPTTDHNLTTNPLFTNAAAGDFSLQAGSPAIDAGVPLAAFATDIAGVARPQGSAWDRGAYEFASGGPTPGPQALRWKFDEGTGTTVADATGNGYTGTLTAAPTWGPGRQGSTMVTMNGVSQYVTTGTLVWTAGQPVTVLLWIKAASCTASGAFGAPSAAVQDRFGAHLPYSDCVAYFDYGDWHTTGRISVDFTPYLGKWTRVALVSSGTGGSFKALYFNGVLAASGASSGAPTTPLTALDVGRWQQESGTLYEAASFDNVSVENRVWSAAEILSDYRQQAMARRHRVSLR